MKNINENIKKYRLEKGITQQEIADKLFVTRQCISRWEQGKSVPDIESLEKLASILEITVSEIIDDESIKTLTINEAIINRKFKKFIWTSLIISALAVLLTIIGYIVINEQYNANKIGNIKNTLGIITEMDTITEHDLEHQIIKFENEENIYILNISYFGEVKFFDNKVKSISYHDLKVGDTIELEYRNELKSENVTKINVIDSKVEKSLIGVILVANGETYESIEDIQRNNDSGLHFYLFEKENNSNHTITNMGLGETKSNITYNGNHFHYDFELNIYFDRAKIINDVVIGLVYSTGIEYVETIDIAYLNSQNRIYNGEMDYESQNIYSVHSADVTYEVNFIETNTFSSIEVYEYDINHNLIKTTSLNFDDYFNFNADENAIYSYIKVTSENDDYYYREVYHLMVGEKLDIPKSDEYGLVINTTFFYHSYSPKN
ncbi:helix-turn-helix transcriptional regulator [Mycoplasmatota bacterium]|nr:helix-turn-helix transcriptional regulator [Mycoplasmatota bacterium]